MSVHSRVVQSAQAQAMDRRMQINRGAAITVWLLGVYTTSMFLGEVGIAQPVNFFIGAAVQFLLTKAQAPMWRSGDRTRVAIVAIAIDAILNAAGIWPYLKNLGATSTWLMVSEWLGSDTAPNMLTKIVITLTLAVLTAAGPEILWEQED